MKPHADNRETFYSETQRDHNLGKKENTFNYAKKYQDLQDRLLKMGTAFMLLEDIFHGEYPHICEKCESIALSYITEFSFTCGMSLKEEREMLYHALLCLDTSEKILSTLLSLGKITAMNFSLINAEIESISLRVRSLYETNEERLLSQTGSNFSKNNSNSFSLEKLEALFQKKEVKETVKEETEEEVFQEKPREVINKEAEKFIPFIVEEYQEEKEITIIKSDPIKRIKKFDENDDTDPFVQARRESVLSYIKRLEVASFSDIKKELNSISPKTLQRDVKALLANNSIDMTGKSRWTLYHAKY